MPKTQENLFGEDELVIINHQGGAMGGHYTANVRTAKGQWMCFNDMSVKSVDASKVITPSAYCLFFRKIKMVCDIFQIN